MFFGSLGLSLTFLILLTVLLIIFVRAEIPKKCKVALIPLLLWFSAVLYFVPDNFTGWSKQAEPPDMTIILALWAQEPSPRSEGGIYVWGIDYPKIEDVQNISGDPKKFIQYVYTREPRCYHLPYSKEMHEKMLKAQRAQNERKDGVLVYKRGMKGKERVGRRKEEGEFEDDSGFKLLKPEQLLPKRSEGTGI